jgi:cytochrome c oxidase assembly factor CtaG
MHAGLTVAAWAGGDWSWEPGIVVPLLLTGGLYARGAAVLATRQRTIAREATAFAMGWVIVAIALLSPLHELSEELFTAHMIQHELLMALAAPLLVLGRPGVVMLWAFPRAARVRIGSAVRRPRLRAVWHVATRPFDAWLLHGVAIWIWHLPALFGAALRSDAVHALQHASFLGSGLLFWWAMLHPAIRARRGMAIVYLFTTVVHTGVLGALMTFARVPWYPSYASGAAEWGLTPMSDQQLAGLIMWIPASVVYLIAALLIVRRWLADSGWTVTQYEQAGLTPSR